jgi:acetyl-CoA acetyltransferase family protein
MREAVIVDACRTAIGRAGDRGIFRAIGGRDLMVPVLQAIVKRNKIDPGIIEDIIMGTVATRQSVRAMALLAGFPESVTGGNFSRFCPSSSTAVAFASHWIMCGDADVMIAAGLETMDREGPVPASAIGKRGAAQQARPPAAADAAEYPPDWKHAEILPPLPAHIPDWIYDMGATAEELSKRFNISRADSDAFALTSHEKAIAAQDAGKFKEEIIPITINYKDGTKEVIDTDQNPRRGSTLEKIAAVPPAYQANGWVTAANSCPRADGAGAVLIMSKEKAKELKLKPLCTFRHAVTAGSDPTVMGIGPVPATEKLLKLTGLKLKDIDVIEINEAFACQVVYSGRMLKFGPEDWAKTNVNGGAVALGHPLGMTGTRQTAVVARELNRRKGRYGLTTLCGATGQALATLFEREEYNW